MKKIFTLIATLACFGAASAANFTVQRGAEGTQTYSDGDVIEVGYTYVDYGGAVNYMWDPELYITGEGTVNLTVTGYDDVQFCGGGTCSIIGYSDNKTINRTMTMTAGTANALQLDLSMWDYEGTGGCPLSEAQEATLKCKMAGETVTITVRFLPSESAGLKTVEAAGSTIAFSGKTMSYNFSKPTTVNVYGIAGQSAITRRLNGQGTLSLQGLPAGVYIYRAGSRTGKFIVR
jgi:hypothetical protein